MKSFRGSALLSGLCLLFVTATAWGGPSRSFSFRLPGEPETLDWNKAHTTIETNLLVNLMEGLLTFDEKMRVAPALAQSWEVSADGRTYTFHLRPGVKWSDGVPLRAQDFVASWKRLLSPLTAASYAYLLFDVEGAEFYNKGALTDFNQVGVRAVDDQTFRVKLLRPVAHWLYIPTFWVTFPIREELIDKYGSAWEKPGKMVTVGPYTLSSYDLDSKLVLKANPLYWGKRGNVEEIVARIVKDDSTALNLYETSKLDFLTHLSTVDLQRLSGRKDFRVFPYLKTGYLGFALNNYPVANVHLRRAVAQAIDKGQISRILHAGHAQAGSFVPPGVLGHDPGLGLRFDPVAARRELKLAGLDPSRPLQLELLLPNWDLELTLGQFVQEQLKKNLGLTVVLQPFDHKTFRSNLDLHAYAVFAGSWAADFPDPDNFLSVFLSGAGNNRSTWKNEKYDELVLGARDAMNLEFRKRSYREAQQLLLEREVVLVPLYYESNLGLVKPVVQGLHLNPLNYLYLKDLVLSP